jgi:glycerol-3-phosphate dehydrogenase (NAD(P)+)
MEISVLGAGSWGTALALVLGRNGHAVALLGRDEQEIADMVAIRQNSRYLPGFELPPSVAPDLLKDHPSRAPMAILAVPASAVREVCRFVGQAKIVVVASKGLEAVTGRVLTESVREECPQASVGVLSGPNLAVEIARGIPTVAVAAYKNTEAAETVREALLTLTFRVSISDDVVGVELAGALKNVLAIGAGMSDGLGFGDNTKGAFLSRGLMEMNRLGAVLGARSETFLGPAGVGDLFATAASRLSRNYRVGFKLAEGLTLPNVLREIGQVAEGVPTAEATLALAKQTGVEMPVFAAVDAVIRGRLSPATAVARLMDRGSTMGDFL